MQFRIPIAAAWTSYGELYANGCVRSCVFSAYTLWTIWCYTAYYVRVPWKRIPPGRDTGKRVAHQDCSHRGPFVRTSAKQVSHRFLPPI